MIWVFFIPSAFHKILGSVWQMQIKMKKDQQDGLGIIRIYGLILKNRTS